MVHIKVIHAETHGGYGWPRTWKELLARAIRVGKERVQKLMQLHGIRAKGKRRFKVTTDSNHDLPIAPNLLDKHFTVGSTPGGRPRMKSSIGYPSTAGPGCTRRWPMSAR